MAALAKAGAAYRASLAAAKDAAGCAETSGMGISAQEDGDKGGRLNERIEKRIMDIEAGRVKMKRYTFDEYMRHLDDMLAARPYAAHP